MTALPISPAPLAEYERVTPDLFWQQIQPAGRPAILRGLLRDWPIVRLRDAAPEKIADYLRPFASDRPVEAFIAPSSVGGRFTYRPDLRSFNFERQHAPIAHWLDAIVQTKGAEDAPAIYAGGVNIPQNAPTLQAEVAMNLLPASIERLTSLWIGNRTRVPAHWDLAQNIACVAHGRRRFTLFPIDQIENLYIGPLDFTPAGQPCSLVDLAAPDLERFPRYAEAAKQALVADLEAGDALYMPSLWIHAVESLTAFGVLVNFWWRDAPPHLVTPTLTLLHALLTLRGMPADERARWRIVFDHYIFNETPSTLEHIPEAARGVLAAPNEASLRRLKDFLSQHLQR